MARGKRRNEQLERMRHAFWDAADDVPVRVPDTYEARLEYERDSLSRQFLDAIAGHMQALGITQQQLAAVLGVTEGRISQILSGEQNLTLKTLASLAAGLKGHFEVSLQGATGGRWEEDVTAPQGPGQRSPARRPSYVEHR